MHTRVVLEAGDHLEEVAAPHQLEQDVEGGGRRDDVEEPDDGVVLQLPHDVDLRVQVPPNVIPLASKLMTHPFTILVKSL